MAPRPKNAQPERIERSFSLSELPSAQHRAGLAGLLLALLSRDEATPGEARIVAADDTGLTVALDRPGLGALLADAWRAEHQPLTDKAGEDRTLLVACPPSVTQLDPGGGWTRLWSAGLLNTLRTRPAQWGAFHASAGGKRYEGHATPAWKALASVRESYLDLSSTLYQGASRAPEKRKVRDRADRAFLLHFAPLVASFYAIEDGTEREGDAYNGFALVVPDVARLQAFVEAFSRAQRARSVERWRFWPCEGTASSLAEASLATLGDLLSSERGSDTQATTLLGVESWHITRPRRGAVREPSTAGALRVSADPGLVGRWAEISRLGLGPGLRALASQNVLAGRAPFEGLDRLLGPNDERISPTELDKVLAALSGRGAPADLALLEEGEPEAEEGAKGTPFVLERWLEAQVGRYLRERVMHRARLTWAMVKDDPVKRARYNEVRGKIAMECFWAVRQQYAPEHFRRWFTEQLLLAPHYLSGEGSASMRAALDETPQRLRELVLVQLHSWGRPRCPRPRNAGTEHAADPTAGGTL